DGMGGHQAGEVASKMVIDYINNYNFDMSTDLILQIDEAINDINYNIIKASQDNPEYNNMGTTLSLGIIYENKLFIGHIGDSRIYIFRDKTLQQLTKDHTLVQELLKQNRIEEEEAFDHPQRHILMQALGVDVEIEIESSIIPLKKKDILLFCTDGISDMLRFKKIKNIVSEYKSDISVLSRKLGEAAIASGGKDNLTVITGIIY
ncbi:MAG: protein phosphatase 2C domain-containing protein, partial [Halanaerobiales bacterium]